MLETYSTAQMGVSFVRVENTGPLTEKIWTIITVGANGILKYQKQTSNDHGSWVDFIKKGFLEIRGTWITWGVRQEHLLQEALQGNKSILFTVK